jgi:protein gp37
MHNFYIWKEKRYWVRKIDTKKLPGGDDKPYSGTGNVERQRLHQLSRPEKGIKRRPRLSDLKDSGGVEQEASKAAARGNGNGAVAVQQRHADVRGEVDMAANSKISWTDHTFNPWWGCVNVSPACDHCYAESFSKRVGNEVWGVDAPRRFFGDKHWNEPLKWSRTALATFGRPARVFCASMADVFEDRAELEPHRERLWRLIADTPNLLWNLLTKRERMIRNYSAIVKHRPNVRIGVTVENQTYDHRIVEGVSWISAEPLLGRLDLVRGGFTLLEPVKSPTGKVWPGMKWVIVGGESGAGARLMELDWAIDLIQQCKAAGVAVHFKQTGDVLARKLGLKDKSGKDPSEWPKELQIQEFPAFPLDSVLQH